MKNTTPIPINRIRLSIYCIGPCWFCLSQACMYTPSHHRCTLFL